MEKVGVIVGNGKLPYSIMKEIEKDKNIEFFPIGLFDTVVSEIKAHKNYKSFNIGQVGEITKYFIKSNIKKVIMLGKVEKEYVFKNVKFDKFGEKILDNLPDKKDETLLFGVIAFFKLNGISVIPQNFFLKKIMFEKKCYTKSIPSEEDLVTIKIGKEAAKALSEVDAGQTVVCKDSSVVALEGLEGTDKAILRGGELGGEGCIVVKMSRPQQDARVDIPTIGVETIKTLVKIKARGVVGEAKKMIFTDQEEAIKLADEHNIFIVGIK